MITDISSEMVTAVLPLYFMFQLQLSPLVFGVLDGLQQAVAAPMKMVGGLVSDRWRRPKEVAAFGYGVSAATRLALPAAGASIAGVTGALLADRAGKGIRTGPRDALISVNSTQESLGTSFGVHRAMDTLGALLGPLLAFALLSQIPGGFNVVFVVSFCVALVGLGVSVLFVDGRPRTAGVATPGPRQLVGVIRQPGVLRLLAIAAALSLFTLSDGFLYLMLQRRADLEFHVFPLLFVGTALAYFLLAIPAGWLADRIGRNWVFVGGYVALLCVYTALLRAPAGPAEIVVYLAFFGAYYAATDGVLMAMGSALAPAETRATGLSLLGTATGLSRFAGAVLFGGLWTAWGSDVALAVLFAGLAVTILLAVPFLTQEAVRDDSA
jgi:MFS family permease